MSARLRALRQCPQTRTRDPCRLRERGLPHPPFRAGRVQPEIPEPTCDGSQDYLDVSRRQACSASSGEVSAVARIAAHPFPVEILPADRLLFAVLDPRALPGFAIRQADSRSMMRVWSSSCSSS